MTTKHIADSRRETGESQLPDPPDPFGAVSARPPTTGGTLSRWHDGALRDRGHHQRTRSALPSTAGDSISRCSGMAASPSTDEPGCSHGVRGSSERAVIDTEYQGDDNTWQHTRDVPSSDSPEAP